MTAAPTLGTVKHLVLICEAELEPLIGRDLIGAGAKGYTVADVRGRGNRGVRDAQWLLSGNIRIDVLCQNDTAHAIVGLVEQKYSRNYGLVVFIQDVVAPRAEKF